MRAKHIFFNNGVKYTSKISSDFHFITFVKSLRHAAKF